MSTADQVVDGLRAAGLPIGEVQVFDASNDPNSQLGRPGQYTSKASFADTRIGTEVDGVEGAVTSRRSMTSLPCPLELTT